jgi:hypothetical protein
VAECAGAHWAMGHDGSFIFGLDMALNACFNGRGVFVEFRVAQIWRRSKKTVAQPADHHHSYEGHETKKIALSWIFFCHETKIFFLNFT